MAKKEEQKKEPATTEQSEVGGSTAQQTPPSSSNKKENVVEVERSVLEQILANQKDLEDKLKSKDADIEMLKSVADKGRLAKYEEQHRGGNLIRTATIGLWEGDIILGWKMVKDEVGVINGVIRETQVIQLYLDKGKGNDIATTDVEYLNFYRNVKRVSGEIIRESRSANGETRVLKLDDGREFEVDIRFINL